MAPDIERFAAFLVLAAALAFAYPKRRLTILLAVTAFAIGLEVAQALAPSRHGRMGDAGVKILGAVSGMALAVVAGELASRLRRRA